MKKQNNPKLYPEIALLNIYAYNARKINRMARIKLSCLSGRLRSCHPVNFYRCNFAFGIPEK